LSSSTTTGADVCLHFCQGSLKELDPSKAKMILYIVILAQAHTHPDGRFILVPEAG
jgi:hypothetical protein